MKLSAPVHELKRRARRLARECGIPLHEALDRMANQEGHARWSLLAARIAAAPPPPDSLLPGLRNGDMLLLGARPGHGKTRAGLRLLLDAAREGRRAVLFTLEYTDGQARNRLETLKDGSTRHPLPDIVTSDDISAGYIIDHLGRAEPGTVAVIDYMQILDRKRSTPALPQQLAALRDFARSTGAIPALISQIDRSFDPQTRPLPDMRDIRLNEPVGPGLFSKACFLHGSNIRLQDVA